MTKLAHVRCRQRPLDGAQRQAAVVALRHARSASRSAGSTCGRTRSGFSLFGTLRHGKPDSQTLRAGGALPPIAYPKPDGKLTFDRLSSVFLSNTNHEEDQPVHLKVADIGDAESVRARRLWRPVGALLPGGRL